MANFNLDRDLRDHARHRLDVERAKLQAAIDGVPIPDCLPEMEASHIGRASILQAWMVGLKEGDETLIGLISPTALKVLGEEMKDGLPKTIWSYGKFVHDSWRYLIDSPFPEAYWNAIAANDEDADRLVSAVKYRPEIEIHWERKRKSLRKEEPITLLD